MQENNDFIGTIKLYAGSYLPKNWMFCNGDMLKIVKYTKLYSIIHIKYGGDGHEYFALPNLNGRAVMGEGNYNLATYLGKEKSNLQKYHTPSHSHSVFCDVSDTTKSFEPQNNIFAKPNLENILCYCAEHDNKTMGDEIISQEGGINGHSNMQPFLALHYIICVEGTYPHEQEPVE